MSRAQRAVNVTDIDEAIPFYTTLVASEAGKVWPGRASAAGASLARTGLDRGLGWERKVWVDRPRRDLCVGYTLLPEAEHLAGEARSPDFSVADDAYGRS